MRSLVFLPAAEADIEAIWDYSADRWGKDQADRYTDDIRDLCEALAQGDKSGRPVDVRPGLLKCRMASHMIYFRSEAERIVVVRVLHSAQDVERNL